jgi:predicted enzyme related to lactoylglutathione lyase
MNEPRTYPEGVTCWVDIEAVDVDEAARFYGVLFGWTFLEAVSSSEVRYLIAQLDGQEAAGIGQPSAANDLATRLAAWNTYIAVQEIDQAAAHSGGRRSHHRATIGCRRGGPHGILPRPRRNPFPAVAGLGAARRTGCQYSRRLELQ